MILGMNMMKKTIVVNVINISLFLNWRVLLEFF